MTNISNDNTAAAVAANDANVAANDTSVAAITGTNAAGAHSAFAEFVGTIAALRAPDGCPWDREQTHESIAKNMLEEAYEAVDAIEAHSIEHLREELGDVLLQVVLQSQIAADAGEFTIADVCTDINAKMIRRHPHVFGDASVDDANGVMDLWEQVKLAEKEAAQHAGTHHAPAEPAASAEPAAPAKQHADTHHAPAEPAAPAKSVRSAESAASTESAASAESTESAASSVFTPPAVSAAPQNVAALPKEANVTAGHPAGLLDDTPRSFPALMECQKISRKAAAAGFEWDTLDDVWDQVAEESAELREAYAAAPKSSNGKISAETLTGQQAKRAAELELGDVLFAVVNIARRMGLDAESALRASNAKFRARWSAMEHAAWAQGRSIEDYTTTEQNILWNEAKQHESE